MENKIIIYPKTKPLSPPELIAQRNISIGSLRTGLKKTSPTGTNEESEELSKIYEELEKQLSIPRIDRLDGRSKGQWDDKRNAVKILQKEGKFNVFGYSLNGNIYLEPYEALFLLELNRIDISYYSMTMSIEQGYLLLLGEENSLNYNNYLVYSLFSRIGYIVQKYQNMMFSENPATIEDCIWTLLENCLQNKPIPDRISNSEHFTQIQNSMVDIRRKIINQENQIDTNEPYEPFMGKIKSTGKRKVDTNDSGGPNKRPRLQYELFDKQKSFIEMLKNEDDYKKFEEIFQSFDIIKLKPQFEYDDEIQLNDLEIQFDIHLHNDNFRKSEPKLPAFRLAILDKNQVFPSRSVISKCYHKQKHKVPVLVVSVSESKHIQAFLYYFT
ncbi:uncharacterized protein LOC129910209 [Episyrphus balteatus]|uniref:uncharacterized protein LOC129910209 n=1 Tax=Episyrphus balteatus TaxID=286459 RepID=UPI002484E607|nr:uncharacterized protein LOC129910209 [Episyrphus balteatus]